jgi:hypothetical protein
MTASSTRNGQFLNEIGASKLLDARTTLDRRIRHAAASVLALSLTGGNLTRGPCLRNATSAPAIFSASCAEALAAEAPRSTAEPGGGSR